MNSVLVYDVTNRGRKMIFNLLDDASANADTNNPKTAQDVGLGFTPGGTVNLSDQVSRMQAMAVCIENL